jgi:hypothetical protein
MHKITPNFLRQNLKLIANKHNNFFSIITDEEEGLAQAARGLHRNSTGC